MKIKIISDFLDKVIESNFKNSLCRSTYLYNELFISLYSWNKFILYGLFLKSNKLIINKYSWVNNKIWKVLLVIIKKYERFFITFLRDGRKSLSNIWTESEFINIFDRNELSFDDISKNLDFTFLDDYSYRRKIQNEFSFEKSILYIDHSDYECSRCCWPKNSFNTFKDFFADIKDVNFFPEIEFKKRDHIYTNITEYESITVWWNEKVSEILATKELFDDYEIINFNKTCISVIMGDDIESIFKSNNFDLEKIIYTDQNIDSWYKAIINFIKNININVWDITKNNKIIFFWLNKNKNTFEIIQFLKNYFDIVVDKVLIPNINTKDLESIMNHNLWVFFIWREVKAQNIFKLYPFDQIESSVPYWITKIKELFKQIFISLWKDWNISKLERILEKSINDHLYLYRKSKNYQLWFIIYDFHVQQFLKDNFRWVPVLSFLCDMWFKLNFYIYLNNDKYKQDLLDLQKLGFNIIESNKKEDLEKFIISKNINCYYSEVVNDKRILSKNKIQFSIWDFEYGIDWFYRTFERLIKKCERQEYFESKLWYYLQ